MYVETIGSYFGLFICSVFVLKIAYIMFYKQRFHSLLKHIIPKNLALFPDFPDSISAKWIKLNQFTNGINGHGPFHRHY